MPLFRRGGGNLAPLGRGQHRHVGRQGPCRGHHDKGSGPLCQDAPAAGTGKNGLSFGQTNGNSLQFTKHINHHFACRCIHPGFRFDGIVPGDRRQPRNLPCVANLYERNDIQRGLFIECRKIVTPETAVITSAYSFISTATNSISERPATRLRR